MKKTLINAVLILVAGIFAGMLLMVLAYMLPLKEDSETMQKSIWILETEGWYPVLPVIKSFDGTVLTENSSGILDNFTDSIMILTAGAAVPEGPLQQAMKAASSMMEDGYAYYWHGYVTVLRPLLLFLDYGDIRVLNQVLQLCAVTFLTCLLYRKKGLPWACLSLTIYILLMPMSLMLSLQYSWVFYIGMAGAAVMVKYDAAFRDRGKLYLLLLILGMLTSYFDLLTYPLFTWGIPMLWWLVMNGGEKGDGRRAEAVIISGLFWILGYGGMWAGKWMLGQLILHRDIIGMACGEVLYRAGMVEGTEGSDVSRMISVIRRFRDYGNVQTICCLCGWGIWFLWRFVRKKAVLCAENSLSLSLLAFSSVVWYLVLHNHTYLHPFTFRTCVISFGAVLAAMIFSVEGETDVCLPQKGLQGGYQRYGKWLIPAAIVGFSGLLALQGRQIYMVHNGASYCEPVRLKGGQTLEQRFTPVYSEIEYIYLGIMAFGDPEGAFTVELLKDGAVCWRTEISALDVADSGFYYIPVKWRLKRGEEYVLKLNVRETEGTEYLATLTTEGELPLAECAFAVIGQETAQGQLIMGFGYSGLLPKSQLLLDLFLWNGAFGLLYLGVLQIFAGKRRAVKGNVV